MKYLLITASLFTIAACGDIEMGGKSMDGSHSKAMMVTPKSDAAKMRFGDTRTIMVKTFAMMDGTRTEVEGASCSMDSDVLSASVTTPAKVAMPIITAPQPSDLMVTCTMAGKSGSKTLPAVPVALGTEAIAATGEAGEALVEAASVVATNAFVYSGVAEIKPLQVGDNVAFQQAQTAVMNIEVDLQ